MSRVVLDTGALIALERGDRALWAALKLSATRSEDVVVPTTALAQAWRGTARQARLGTVLQSCVLSSFDSVARSVGELCGRAKTKDICDAHVAIAASSPDTILYTSDPEDLRHLITTYRRSSPIIVHC
jgi:hypothetical protein